MAVTVFLDANEITSEVFAVNVRRGRDLETDAFNPGGGTIYLRNYNANFNADFLSQPSYLLLESGDKLLLETSNGGGSLLLEGGNGGSGGAYGDIDLGRKITVKDGAVTVFTGYVEDVDYEYGADKSAVAVFTVRDLLVALGATNLKEWTTTAGQYTGTRLAALLDRTEVGFPTGATYRDIATGTQDLGSETIASGTNALQEAQRLNQAEYGRCFVNAAGQLVFQDRYDVYGLIAAAAFDDTDTNLPFSALEIRYGTELLHFSVTVTRTGGSEQTATDAALIAGYPTLGVRHYTVTGAPFQSDAQSLGLANLLLSRYTNFSPTISGLSVKLAGLSTADRATVCGLEIGNVITVDWTPVGTTGSITQTLAIEAVTYSASETRDDMVSFQLSDASDPGYFVVDTDSVDGTALLAP